MLYAQNPDYVVTVINQHIHDLHMAAAHERQAREVRKPQRARCGFMGRRPAVVAAA